MRVALASVAVLLLVFIMFMTNLTLFGQRLRGKGSGERLRWLQSAQPSFQIPVVIASRA